MDAFKKLLLLAGAALLALTLTAGPALAAEAEDTGEEVPMEETDAEAAEEHGGKIQIADTPRQQVGLILLGFLVIAGGLALLNARRQLKGERPAASGEFRWR